MTQPIMLECSIHKLDITTQRCSKIIQQCQEIHELNLRHFLEVNSFNWCLC